MVKTKTMTKTLHSHFIAMWAQRRVGGMGCQPDLSSFGISSSWSQGNDELFKEAQSLLGQAIANSNAVVDKDATFCSAQGTNYEAPKEEEVLKDHLSKRDCDCSFGARLQKLLNGEIAFTSTDSATQNMMREFNMDEKESYKGLCKKEQEEFRVAWARTQLTSLVEKTASHIKEYQKINTSVGEYMSAARVFKMEWGTQEDIAPTRRLLRNNNVNGMAPCHLQSRDRAI